MARLGRQPSSAVIMALRGTLDLYELRGQWMVRTWPAKSRQPRTRGEIASSERFTAATKGTSLVGPVVRELYRESVVGFNVTWPDAQRALALARPWWTLGD